MHKHTTIFSVGFLMTSLIMAGIVFTQYAYATGPIVVTADNPNGWGFFQETPTGSGAFVSGPFTAPLGSGSAQFTVNGTGGELFGTFAYVGTRLDAITSLAYNTYRVSGSSALAPSLQFDIDTNVTDANTAWQGRLVYEPYYTHTVSTGVWQTWNPLDNAGTGNWWFTGAPGNAVCPISNPCTWTELLTAFPNAGIRSAGANTGAIQFKAGGGWTGGFVGNVDAFSIGVNNVVTSYDFESPLARLTLIKTVVNDNGGTATVPNFQLLIFYPVLNSFSEIPSGEVRILNPGSYTVSENGDPAHYAASVWGGDCNANGTITLVSGQVATCTITNDDIAPVVTPPAPATLHVIKQVINVSGGTSVASDFQMSVKNATSGVNVSGSPQVGTLIPGTLYTLPAGTYTVSEGATTTYTQSFFGADCVPDGTVTLAPGEDKVCTIINTDIAPPPPVPPPPPVVVVSSGGGGGGGGGNGPVAGSLSSSGGGGGGPVAGFPNTGGTAIVPLIGILEVPSPLALPLGPGMITYTYTVWNVGWVQPLINVTVTDDKCSHVVLLSGDVNANHKLDPGESWKYSCTTMLSNTTTNTAIATGHSDDGFNQTTVATAIATVVVGSAIPSPLINIVKVPSRLTPFPIGGGDVTYVYTVTNPGVAAIHDVLVTDDRCAPVVPLSGDTNDNSLLDPRETWTYTCRTHISGSTMNIATAKGKVNGILALDYAFATVLVALPGLPDTGTTLPSASIRTITVDLKKGSGGSDVSLLQKFLISQHAGPAAEALSRAGVTAYFGSRTRAALAEFQTSVGVIPALGNFGPITRAYVSGR